MFRVTSVRFAIASVGFLLAAGVPHASSAQTLRVGDPLEEYLRVVQVAGGGWDGSFTVRPFRGRIGERFDGARDPWHIADREPSRRDMSGSTWVDGVQARFFGAYNSAFPDGGNDGAIWQGKGLTAALQGGATFGIGRLSIAIRPLVTWSQNSDFPLANPNGATGNDVYLYPWRPEVSDPVVRIDLPQRFGPDAFTRFDPGESAIRAAFGPVSLGVGTEDLWWGPGVRNSILMTNTAGGFPKADVSTNGPVDIGIGTLEAQWVVGRLLNSEWWNPAIDANDRFFQGLVVAWSPSFVDGLTLGVGRALYEDDRDVGILDAFDIFAPWFKESLTNDGSRSGNDDADQLASIFMRWVFPESGFETWAEWAKNDHAWAPRDLIVQLGHAEGYQVGLRRVFDLSDDRLLSVTAEITHLERSQSMRIRDGGTWYEHFEVRQGYTHEGQLLGASLGPGGNGQFLGFDLWHAGGRAGGYIERRVHNNDAFYVEAEGIFRPDAANVSFDVGGRALLFRGPFDLEADVRLTKEHSRYYVPFDDVWNLNVNVGATWRLR